MRIRLKQSITVSVCLHRFKPIVFRMFLFAVSKIALLIPLNSFFDWFMSLTVRFLLKFSLLSFFQNFRSCCSRHLFPIGLAPIYFLRFVFHQYWSAFISCCWLFCISRLQRCLSLDRIPLLLIGKGLLFYRQKWLSYLMI